MNGTQENSFEPLDQILDADDGLLPLGSGRGLHYLCAGYKKFFLHIRKYLRAMTQLINAGQPVPLIMQALKGPLAVPVVSDDSPSGKLQRG